MTSRTYPSTSTSTALFPISRYCSTTYNISCGAQEISICDEGNKGMKCERGIHFITGDAFYRHESILGRDLGVLAAALYKKKHGHLRVIDAMCGCGVRAARYLAQAEADLVWANDGFESLTPLIIENMSLVAPDARISDEIERSSMSRNFSTGNTGSGWMVSHEDANKLLMDCYMRKDFYDMIDIDSFGSNTIFLGSALSAIKHGGLLYVTSTDGFSSAGHRPYNALASYGAYIKPMPFANEIGLRMLIGGVVREAALRNMNVVPMFSYYSFHGPVFRVMLRVHEGKLNNKHYGFIGYCHICGHSQAFQWEELGCIRCFCRPEKIGSSMVVSGPIWTGPLHNAVDLEEIIWLAKDWGWAANVPELLSRDLLKVLETMLGESNPALPCGYIKLPLIAKIGNVQTPKRDDLICTLQKEGYAAALSHIESNAIKTNCPVGECLDIIKQLRPNCPC